MRRLLLVVLAVASLAGCAHRRMLANDRAATRGTSMASEDDKDAARQAFVGCMRTHVPALDDGTSDAATISAAVSATCPDEWNAYSDMIHQGRPPSRYAAIEKDAEDERKEMALTLVLEMRRKR